MRRTWFKKEMKQAILDGKKVSTTRDHPIPIGETQAVSGSRFKPDPFAILEIQDRIPTTVANVVRMFYEEEGFASSEEMVAYAKKNKLLQDENVPVWYHRFRIVKILSDLKEASLREMTSHYKNNVYCRKGSHFVKNQDIMVGFDGAFRCRIHRMKLRLKPRTGEAKAKLGLDVSSWKRQK